MKIDFAGLYKALQHAEDWYWDDIHVVMTVDPEDKTVTLSPDVLGSDQMLTLLLNLADMLEGLGVIEPHSTSEFMASASMSSTYWGPRITLNNTEVTNVPSDVAAEWGF